jgi:CBS domain-containing protein
MNANTHDCSRLPASRGTAEPFHVRINDSAARVVSDSTGEVLWTIGGDCGLDEVLDKMAELGVPAFLVTREQQVVGLVTFDDVQRQRGPLCGPDCVADVMTDASHVPMIDWQTVLDATVSDMLQIFDRTHANHLVVVDTESSAFTRVRGLVYRRHLVRQLGVFPILDRGMRSALAQLAAC